MIIPKTAEEIELMRESALLVSKTLGEVAKVIKPGITTLELDKLAEEFIRDNDGIPGFLGLYGFPNSLCISPNAQVVHGIPNNIPLQEGDVVYIEKGLPHQLIALTEGATIMEVSTEHFDEDSYRIYRNQPSDLE